MTASPSTTPQARKLGIKPGQRVRLDRPPPGWALTDPPSDLDYVGPTKPADLILSFFTAAEQLSVRLPDLVEKIYPAGALWIAWAPPSRRPRQRHHRHRRPPTRPCLWAWWM